MRKIWGDNFYDEETKKWYKEEEIEGRQLNRGFAKFVMEPICKLSRSIAMGEKKEYEELIEKLKINLNQE